MPFPEIARPSPNFDSTAVHERLGVVFHHSVVSFDAAIALMTDPARKVSYHCLIAPDGTRCTLVGDEHVAWHAGVSTWQGRTGCNAFMLGLSFAGNTYEAPLTDAQVESALEWLAPRWTRYNWKLEWMTDHRQVAPERKDDLKLSEWDKVYRILESRFGNQDLNRS